MQFAPTQPSQGCSEPEIRKSNVVEIRAEGMMFGERATNGAVFSMFESF